METINLNIIGSYVRRDKKNAGVQGESNTTLVHIVFDRSWEGRTKTAVWKNAAGEEATAIVLYNPVSDSLEGADPLEITSYIPAEAMTVAGWCSVTIKGYADDPASVELTATTEFEVLFNDTYADTEHQPVQPTPSQAEQLEIQISEVSETTAESLREALEKLDEAEEAVKLWEVWSSSKAYVPLNKVARGGNSYICKAANTNVDPVSDVGDGVEGVYWLLIAKKGDRGERGLQGETGASGTNGTNGINGTNGTNGKDGRNGTDGKDGVDGAPGEKGEQGEPGINGVAVAASGQYAFNVDANGHLLLMYNGDEAPDFSIDENGHLILTL